jgi:hypothetical protein
MVRSRVQQKRGPGCLAEADVTLPNAGALGRDGDPHRGWEDMRDGLAGEVGKDPASHS